MTFKCKSIDYGHLFHLTSNGQQNFHQSPKAKNKQKEIIREYQLKLESNFMMYFDEEVYPTIYLYDYELFVMQIEVQKFILTIQGLSARLHQQID